jgi:hypothetical protein
MRRFITILTLVPTLGFSQWTQLGNSIDGQVAGDRCGTSVAISADGLIMAVGARDNDNGGSSSGHVRAFGYANGVWSQIGADINGETSGDQSGTAVSLSSDGSILAIGEPFNNDLGFVTGQVRVFQNVNNSWSQLGADVFGQTLQSAAGTSLDLTPDGTVLAVGAPNTGVNGSSNFIGNVRVFNLVNNNWVQKGGDINGDGAIIRFGQSVSLSADGNRIAIGQTGDPTDGDTGRVKLYEFVNNQWTQLGNTIFGIADNDEFGYQVSLSAAGTMLVVFLQWVLLHFFCFFYLQFRL